MSHDAVITTLKSLRLHGMAQALDELAQQGASLYREAMPLMSTLLKAEVAEREVRSINYQLKVARFPIYRDLSSFDFAQSAVDEALGHCGALIGGIVEGEKIQPGTSSVHSPSRKCVILSLS